jgi:hypothetical protein
VPTTTKIVVDACVLSSAGRSEHPVSSRSRAFLQAVLDDPSIECPVCPKLLVEWNKHITSSFSVAWRKKMVDLRRLHFSGTRPLADVRTELQAFASPDERDAALKDVHLIELAFWTDEKVIFSNEKGCRGLFHAVALKWAPLRAVAWLSPVDQPNATFVFLRTATLGEDRFYLGMLQEPAAGREVKDLDEPA